MAVSAMQLWLEARARGEDVDAAEIIQTVPYAKLLGVKAAIENGELIAEMPFEQKLIGNPNLPALHGGAIGSFLEISAILELIWRNEGRILPKTVGLTIEYLRSGKPEPLYAKTEITKMGRRVSVLRVTAWQSDPAKPVATAHGNFLMDPFEG